MPKQQIWLTEDPEFKVKYPIKDVKLVRLNLCWKESLINAFSNAAKLSFQTNMLNPALLPPDYKAPADLFYELSQEYMHSSTNFYQAVTSWLGFNSPSPLQLLTDERIKKQKKVFEDMGRPDLAKLLIKTARAIHCLSAVSKEARAQYPDSEIARSNCESSYLCLGANWSKQCLTCKALTVPYVDFIAPDHPCRRL